MDAGDYELIWIGVCVSTAPVAAALLSLVWDGLRDIFSDWRTRRRNGF